MVRSLSLSAQTARVTDGWTETGSKYDISSYKVSVKSAVCNVFAIHTYIHTYMKFITRCIGEDGSNQRRVLLLGGGV